jgi:flagellar assembly protein FliH
LNAEFPGMAMLLLADASIERGGCLVESAGTVVDGRLEKRWSRAIGQLGLQMPWEAAGDEP